MNSWEVLRLEGTKHIFQIDEMNFPDAPLVSRQFVTKIDWETFAIGFTLFAKEEVHLIDPVDFSVIGDFVSGHPRQGR